MIYVLSSDLCVLSGGLFFGYLVLVYFNFTRNADRFGMRNRNRYSYDSLFDRG